MMIDKHTLAMTSIVGSSLDVLGALYLAYDLLGGEHGPLRALTGGVTYGLLFGAGYGIACAPGKKPERPKGRKLFSPPLKLPQLPGEVRQKMTRLLARMLNEHLLNRSTLMRPEVGSE